MPSSSFQHLTNQDEAKQALHRFYDHLNPGGLLAMSLRVFEPEDEIPGKSTGSDPSQRWRDHPALVPLQL
ncbi:MAG: hypothetical protein IPG51_04075 [Chloroflexi bacterium]|nr:hypothetical protein [Chloroflexota bacterium]